MSNVPRLRFKEFSGDFEYDVLDELFKISSKKFDPSKHTEVKKCIELEHLAQGTGNLLGYTFSNEQASIKNSFEKGQVLFGKLRPYLKKFWQADFDGVCSSEIWVLKGKKLTNSYLYHLVQTNKFNQIANVSSGSKMPRSDWQYMSQVPFSFPSKSEQEKIASFLTSVDTKIELLGRKEELLQQYKKGVMQKIFSQEIRFKADDGSEYPEWKEKKLKSYLIKHDEVTTENNQYPVLTSSRKGIFFQKDYFDGNDVASKDNTGYNVVPRGYFTYRHMSDDFIFKVNINDIVDKGIVSTLYPVFTTQNINDKFLQLKLNEGDEFKRYVLIQKQGGSRTYMYFKKLQELKVNLPCIKEQNKIVNFLSSIDSKIAQVSAQLNATKAFKKALLQQMFV